MALNCPQAAVDACVNDLEVMADPASPQGQTLTQFRSQLSNDLRDGELKGEHKIIRAKQRPETCRREFIKALLENLHERY